LHALLLAALCAAPALAPAAAPAASEPPPLELAKLTVIDRRTLPPPEAWRYAQVPGLEILSSASDRETQKLLRDFRLFNDAIGVVWPALKAHRAVPMTLILSGPGKNFAAFVPDQDGKSPVARASVFLRSPEQVAIALNFGVKTLDLAAADADAAAPAEGFATAATPDDPSVSLRVDYYRQLYREYVRYLLSFSQPRLPAWLEEGLTQLLVGMKVDPKFIEFARLEDPNLGAPGVAFADDGTDTPAAPTTKEEHDFNGALHHRGLIPLADFFAVTHDSPEAVNALTGTWPKQAQALVHLWLYGEGKKYNQGFARFVTRSLQEPVTEPMFKECFGLGYDQMLTALRLYIGNTAYQYKEYNAGSGAGLPEPAPLALRDATEAEVGRIKGEAAALAGHRETAHDEMQAPYARGNADAALLAALGLLETGRGETARARKFLEAAAQKQAVRPRAYLELAKLRLAQAQPANPNPVAALTATQTQSVLQPLLIVRQQPPPLPEVYELMADVWLRSDTPPTQADLAVLNQGVMTFQRRPVLLLHAAELNGRYGDPAAARAMVDFGLKLARTAEAKQVFEELKASLPPGPAK
jgi:hypothetical protein